MFVILITFNIFTILLALAGTHCRISTLIRLAGDISILFLFGYNAVFYVGRVSWPV